MQELATAEAFEGRTTPASGALWGSKGDVVTDAEMVENKRTDKNQIILKKSDLRKLWSEATASGKVPYMAIEIDGDRYVLHAEGDFLEWRYRKMTSG